MNKHDHLTTIAVIGMLTISAPVFADDGDVQHARLLLEEAHTFGVPDVTGQAAGQIEAERELRRQEAPEFLDENEQRWHSISQSQSHN